MSNWLFDMAISSISEPVYGKYGIQIRFWLIKASRGYERLPGDEGNSKEMGYSSRACGLEPGFVGGNHRC